MLEIKELAVEGYERVIEAIDSDRGLHAFIAVHNTRMGPALGGTRIYPYASREDALKDVLRLSRGMTFKSAIAEIGLGGGKSVIIADPHTQKTPELLAAFAEAVHSLDGLYVCAEDVGTTTDDMAIILESTPYVAALETNESSGDPSPFTAWGVFRGMQAVALRLWNTTSLRGKRIAIQGLGKVGRRLGEFLFWHGARLIVCDLDAKACREFAHEFGAEVVDPEDFFATPCDILAPCAMGGIINDETIPQLRCAAIAGAANNQLAEPRHGQQLMDRGILYAPDYVINGGGIINAAAEFDSDGYHPIRVRRQVDHIFDTLMDIFNRSDAQQLPTEQTANDLAQHKLEAGIGRRLRAIDFGRDVKSGAA